MRLRATPSFALLLPALVSCAPATGIHAEPTLTGSASRGAVIFDDRERGHCVLCHTLAASAAPFQGNIGPALDDVGSRLTAAEIRYRVADMTRLNPDTRMPAYHRSDNLSQVADKYTGRPVLTTQELEDMVAFLVLQTGTRSGAVNRVQQGAQP